MKTSIALHSQILIALMLGLILALVLVIFDLPKDWVAVWVAPIGVLFIKLLKMIAVPLVLASLVIGIAHLSDVSRLSRMGGKTIALYILTTLISISVGLLFVNLSQPGDSLPEEMKVRLMDSFSTTVEGRIEQAQAVSAQSPLTPLVNAVPDNIFAAFSDNSAMLQVAVFALMLGVALLHIKASRREPVVAFFEGLNDAILVIIDFIMRIAPIGVFALILSVLVDIANEHAGDIMGLVSALIHYSLTVIFGLLFMGFVVYPLIIKLLTKVSPAAFLRGVRPAQLVAFSTSSSAATLPITMKCVEENLAVDKNVSSFVLPLGATINMDGTSLYQAVAAVFIAQSLGMDLSISQQLMIVFTALLASIGTAGVPGAGIVMLLIVLESIGVPAAGIALILVPDRFLDMSRTALNVSGDAMVSAVIADSEKAIDYRKIES